MYERVVQETIKFMRGRYCLDEVAGVHSGNPCVRFRQGSRTIVTVLLHPDDLEFLLIFGTAERQKFEEQRSDFPQEMQDIYDHARTLHNGKRLLIRVDDLATLATVQKLILLKKKSNRKPASKEDALYGKCGHRCDQCVHFIGITEERRAMLIPHLTAVYGSTNWDMRCTGCDTPGCQCYQGGSEVCPPIICLKRKNMNACFDCQEYPCKEATVGYRSLEARSISADDVTWAILPYVPHQYGN